MYGTYDNPFSQFCKLFSGFLSCAMPSGRCFYTRKERIEHLEQIKKKLQDEIAGIDELIADLKHGKAKHV